MCTFAVHKHNTIFLIFFHLGVFAMNALFFYPIFARFLRSFRHISAYIYGNNRIGFLLILP